MGMMSKFKGGRKVLDNVLTKSISFIDKIKIKV